MMASVASRVIAYEAGEMEADDVIALFVDLFNLGVLGQDQGSYQRVFWDLLRVGLIVIDDRGKAKALDEDH